MDVGDENDVGDLFDCFEVLQTGTGNDTINNDACGSATMIPGDGDDFVEGGAGADVIDWSSSTTGMVIDITNESATGQGTDTWDDVLRFVGSGFDDTMLVTANAPGPGVAELLRRRRGRHGRRERRPQPPVSTSSSTSSTRRAPTTSRTLIGSAFNDNLEVTTCATSSPAVMVTTS